MRESSVEATSPAINEIAKPWKNGDGLLLRVNAAGHD
jgi:hypothetical protein